LLSIQKECIELPLLDPVCITLEMHACEHVGLHLNVTFGQQTVIDTTIDSVSEIPNYCWDTAGETCQTCLAIKSLDFTPTYAKVCPELVLDCKIGSFDLKPVETPLQCLEIGDMCEALDCVSCLAQDGCGWCSDKEVGCESSQGGTPWCAECNSPFTFVTDTCDLKVPFKLPPGMSSTDVEKAIEEGKKRGQDNSEGTGGGNTALIVVIVIAALLLVVAIVLGCMYKRRKSTSYSRAAPTDDRNQYSEPIQLQDEDGELSQVETAI